MPAQDETLRVIETALELAHSSHRRHPSCTTTVSTRLLDELVEAVANYIDSRRTEPAHESEVEYRRRHG